MFREIDASYDVLMRQAPKTIGQEYLPEAIKYIDQQFGPGYSIKNPKLIAEFIRCCAIDFNTTSITQALQTIAQSLNNISSSLCNEE